MRIWVRYVLPVAASSLPIRIRSLPSFERDIPAGILCYPAAQAADITAVKVEVVPVGEDQVRMFEQFSEIVRRISRQVVGVVLPEARALLTGTGRLPSRP